MKLPKIFQRKAKSVINDTGTAMTFVPNGFMINNPESRQLLNDGFGANSTIYGMVMTMYTKFGSIPWILYRVKDKKKASNYNLLTKDYTSAALIKKMKLKRAAFDEVTGENDIVRLWDKPNDYETGQQFRERLLMFMKTVGAAPVWANMGTTGISPLELHGLFPQNVRLQPRPDLFTFNKVFYGANGAQVEVPIDQFHYWKYPSPFFDSSGKHIYGLSPLRAGQRAMAADNENTEAMAFQFRHKGATGVFTPKDAAGTVAAERNIDSLRQIIDERTNGRNYDKLRTLINFPLDYHSFGMSAVDMESIAAKKMSKEDMAGLYNFPGYLNQMTTGTDARYTQAVKYLITNTIYPDLTGMRAWLNEWLLPLFGHKDGQYYWDFDLSVMPELQEDLSQLVTSLDKMWYLTGNEKRLVSNYDELDNPLMNEVLVPTNLQPLSASFDAMENIDPSIFE